MRILIAEDNQNYLDQARIASKRFPEHEFVFDAELNKEHIDECDAVITDYFFEVASEKEDEAENCTYYLRYLAESSSTFWDVMREYAKDHKEPERTWSPLANFANYLSDFDKQLEMLEGGNGEWAIGGYIARQAAMEGKPVALVTSIHRHALSGGSSVHGIIALLPMIVLNILTIDQVVWSKNEGKDNLLIQNAQKDNPGTWEQAISWVVERGSEGNT